MKSIIILPIYKHIIVAKLNRLTKKVCRKSEDISQRSTGVSRTGTITIHAIFMRTKIICKNEKLLVQKILY